MIIGRQGTWCDLAAAAWRGDHGDRGGGGDDHLRLLDDLCYPASGKLGFSEGVYITLILSNWV